MAVEKPSVRRSQIISTYGIGAVVPVRDGSYMIAGLDRWEVGAPDVHEPRLERTLEVDGFVRPPASGPDGRKDVPAVRFPTYHFCPQCKRLDEHKFFCPNSKNRCNDCDAVLVPSRFVVVCDRGHIDDFPYFAWVHSGSPPEDGEKHTLSIETAGQSAGLADIRIKCECGKESTMQGAFGKEAMNFIRRKCGGRRPWLGDRVECGADLRTLQRGASNVYFGVSESALSIPPWSEAAYKLINADWHTLKHLDEIGIRSVITGRKLAEGSPYTTGQLVKAALERKAGNAVPAAVAGSLRAQEYDALRSGKAESSRHQDFVCVPAAQNDPTVEEWFAQAMAVKRLREVRALRSFTRLFPPAPGDNPGRRAPLSKDRKSWLPAIEVSGEGVFLRLADERLLDWEAQANVRARAAKIDRNYAARFAQYGKSPDRNISARLILLHTLAHALIDQWSLECGYPSGSLRERLYSAEANDEMPMAGLLIYTATTDAAGSLGGVTALADGGRLGQAVKEAMQRASWCSSDPLCIESDATGTDSLNLAACHACVLVPEVSCEHANALLDRGLLVGTPEMPDLGYFSDLIERL